MKIINIINYKTNFQIFQKFTQNTSKYDCSYAINLATNLPNCLPVLTPPLGKIQPLAIHHFTVQLLLKQSCNFKSLSNFLCPKKGEILSVLYF